MMKDDILELKANLFRALGHPARLKIVELLRDGEHCVCEIIPLLEMEQSTVSRHLAVLRQSGLVTSRKEGQRIFYRLTSKEIPKLLSVAADILKRELKLSKELLENL